MIRANKVSMVFGVLGLVMGGLAAAELYFFFGPDGENLGIAGVSGVLYLAVFPVTSALVGAFAARSWFVDPLTWRAGSARGAMIGLLSFLVCLLIHAFLMMLRLDTNAALWLMLAALLFGGIAFGLPAMFVSAVAGGICARAIR